MTTEALFLLILIVLFAGAIPAWPYSKSWGYAPTGILTVVLLIFVIWAVAGGRPLFRNSGRDIGETVQDAGRDVAGSFRRTLQ